MREVYNTNQFVNRFDIDGMNSDQVNYLVFKEILNCILSKTRDFSQSSIKYTKYDNEGNVIKVKVVNVIRMMTDVQKVFEFYSSYDRP